MSRRFWSLVAVAGTLAVFSLAQAQDEGGRRDRRDRRDGPGRERRLAPGEAPRSSFDPVRIQERMLNMLKEQSGADDAEWEAVSPKVLDVLNLRRQLRPGMGGAGMGGAGMRGRRDGRRGAEERRADTAEEQGEKIEQAYRDLRTALRAPDTSAEEIKRRLTTLREERSKVQRALDEAQKQLKDAASPRIEAVLVLNGILD